MAKNLNGGVNVPVAATWNGKALKQAEAQMNGFKKSVSKPMIGVGATLGGLVAFTAIAGQLKQMATNAMEDQKSMTLLSTTMKNLGLGTAQGQVEDFIKTLSLQTGEVDDSLRPAMDRLLKSTGNVTEAEKALKIAQDAGVSSGRTTLEIANLLGKGYDGNTMALGRAGLGLDASILKSKDMKKITSELARLTGGQAAAAAATYAGKVQRINNAVGEAQETIGYALLKALDSVSQSMGGTGGFVQTISDAGDKVALVVTGVGAFIDKIRILNDMTKENEKDTGRLSKLWNTAWVLYENSPFGAGIKANDFLFNLGKDAENTAEAMRLVKESALKLWPAIKGPNLSASSGVAAVNQDMANLLRNTNASKNAVDALKTSLDILSGKKRSVREAQSDFFAAQAEASQVGVKTIPGHAVKVKHVDKNGKVTWRTQQDAHGNTVMTPDRTIRRKPKLVNGALDLSTSLGRDAQAALDRIGQSSEARAQAILDANGRNAASRAAAALQQGRDAVAKQAKAYGMTNFGTYLPPATTQDLTQRQENQARQQGITNQYIFSGSMLVADAVDAVEQAKKNRRLQALSAGRGNSNGGSRRALAN